MQWWNIKFLKQDISSIINSIRKRRISQGKNCELLEKLIQKKLKVKYCLTCSSGTAATIMSLLALNLKKGDEVIMSNRTWIAPINVMTHLGLKIKLIDVNKDLPIIDCDLIEKNITKKTRLIFCVSLNGRSPDINKIKDIIKKKKIYLIEDAAQSLISKYNNKYIGTQSEIGIFSFSMTKIISSGQGGFVVTNKKSLYEKMHQIRNHGLKNPFELNWNKFGLNFKFTDIQAALIISQLKRIETCRKTLIENYKFYRKQISKIPFIKMLHSNVNDGEVPLWTECISKHRNKIITYLNKKNIMARYSYPNASHILRLKLKNINFSNSNYFEKYSFYLPNGVNFGKKDILRVSSHLKKIKI
jgi:perosamine synthetase